MVSRFFANVRDQSEIKLRILRRFLTPWAAKLGTVAKNSSGVIWYVDGFAGPGRYGDGTDGSPLIGLQMAQAIKNGKRGYELANLFVENKLKNWKSLEQLSVAFRANGVTANNLRGKFADLIPEISRTTAGSPMLLFVDPFGISPIKYEQLRTLLNRRWPIDLILNFSHRAVYRLATNYPHLITEAIGSGNWLHDWNLTDDPGIRINLVMAEFKRNMLADGRFANVLFYPIRPKKRSSAKYYLVFASRHYDAFELWNDEVATEEIALSKKQYTEMLSQSSFLPEFDDEIRGINLLNEIGVFTKSSNQFTRREIIMHFVQNRWGLYRTRDIKRAVGSLTESGAIKRLFLEGQGIDSDVMISG